MTNQTKTNHLNHSIDPTFIKVMNTFQNITIAIDLSKQIELENPDLRQQINFIGKPQNDKATMFFIIQKSEETTFEFLQNSVSII